MTKLEFLTEPYMILRLENLSLIYDACFCIEFSQALLMPYERFVMLLKSRSRKHHPHMHYFYTGSWRKNTPFHLDPPKNVLLLHWEWTPEIYPTGYTPNKYSKFLLLSLKSFVAEKRHVAMQKLFIKKKRIGKKWTSVRDI
jgi:hypothetical protein